VFGDWLEVAWKKQNLDYKIQVNPENAETGEFPFCSCN
jgi:hypothetical protein